MREDIMIICYADGSFAEGAICRLEGSVIHATVEGADGAVQFTLVQNKWTTPNGRVVTFEFPSDAPTDATTDRQTTGVGMCAAGGDCMLRRMAQPGEGPVN